MKTLALTLLLFLGTGLLFAQHPCENKNILFCESDAGTISKKELKECATLSVTRDNLEVVSFIVSWKPDDRTLAEQKVNGNELSESVIKSLRKAEPGTKIYFEKVTLSNGLDLGCKILELVE